MYFIYFYYIVTDDGYYYDPNNIDHIFAAASVLIITNPFIM